MPQDFTFGRIGLATASGGDGLEVNLTSWKQEGDEASISGIIRKQSTLADVKALRDQFQGYGPDNTDEPVIPVTWSKDSSRDGFYRVQSCDVSTELTERPGFAGWAYRWGAELVRVPNWTAPRYEIICSGALRTNAHAVALATTLTGTGFPVGGNSTFVPVKTVQARTSAEGAAPFAYPQGDASVPVYEYIGSTSNFYKASARVEVSADAGTTWRSVVGRQVANSPSAVRVSNGYVRAWITSAAVLQVQHYDGSTWETTKSYALDYGAGDFSTAPPYVTVLRNSPARSAIRVNLALDNSPTADRLPYIDLALARGSRYVDGYLFVGINSGNIGIRRSSVEAATALTGGIRATSNDADGNRYVLAGATPAITNDLVNGAINTTAGSETLPFCVGSEIGGSGATGADTAQNVVYEYLFAGDHKQRTTAR